MGEKYGEHKIVPEVLGEVPPETLSVEWKVSGVKCYPGDELTPTQVKTQPILNWRAFQERFYTVLFVHLGPTADPTEELHWLVFNVPGNNVVRGRVHAEYIESGPQKDTGLHRYLYLVYQQPSNTRLTPKDAYRPRHLEGRKPWNTRDFAQEYGLGDPVAGNFYLAEYDEFVPTFDMEVKGHTGLLLAGVSSN